MSEPAIKTMKLYHQVERVYNELSQLGIGPDDPIDAAQLAAFDQYHYLGTEAVDEAVSRLSLDRDTAVVEVGSGIGGPARHLATACGCHTTALELQADLNRVAHELTARCGLQDRVSHRCADVLDGVEGEFDALVSWLTFLHIPDRPRLYACCHDALRPDGGLYVEDYFAKNPLTGAECEMLARDVYCEHVPTLTDYERELSEAGFAAIELIDMSDAWTAFVVSRRDAFAAATPRNVRVHGEALVHGLSDFYDTIVALFEGGNLGGLRLVARKG